MVFTLVFDATLIGSLLFGYLFLLTIAPNWPPPAFVDPDPLVAAGSLVGLGALWFGADRAERANRRDRSPAAGSWLVFCGCGGIVSGASFLLVPLLLAPPPAEHAYGASVLMLAAVATLHCALAAIGALFTVARLRAGYLSAARAGDVAGLRLLCRFAAGAGAVILLAIYLLPLAMRS